MLSWLKMVIRAKDAGKITDMTLKEIESKLKKMEARHLDNSFADIRHRQTRCRVMYNRADSPSWKIRWDMRTYKTADSIPEVIAAIKEMSE